MRLWVLLLTFVPQVIALAPAGAGTWPVEAEDENGMIDRRALSEQDHRLQAQLDSLYTQIDVKLQEAVRSARADSVDSLQVSCAIQRRDLFLEARRSWAEYCRATAGAVFFEYCGGSIAGAAQMELRIKMITARMQELRDLFSDFTGPSDEAMTLTRLLFAAGRGDAQSQCTLGKMYYTGKGVPVNYAESLRWYRLAANGGNAEAQDALGPDQARFFA